MIDTSKVIHAPVGGGRYTVTAPIVKEDYGLYLKIEGLELPSTYEVDFSNSEHNGTSVTMIGNADGVLIPSQFISSGKDVFAFLYHVGADFGRTIYKFRIPNKLRPDRTDEEPTPEEQSTIDQAISALNSAVEQTAQDVASAHEYAQASASNAESASASAQSADASREAADESEYNAQVYAENAQASATASAQSASQSAQIKADVEDLVDDAQASATASAQSASASANSASQASGYATSASQSASSAQGYASQAQTSAQTASAKASEASGYASTASTQASEALSSALSASGYATQAESAKTASQTAQGLAESARDSAISAQESAEDARDEAQSIVDGISGKVEQIDQNTADIASLEADRYKPYAVDSASGAIASFVDGADDIPLKSLIVDINPVQDLSQGDPSPENICPISGWTGANVVRDGTNLWGGNISEHPSGKRVSGYGTTGGYPRLNKIINPNTYTLSVICNLPSGETQADWTKSYNIRTWFKSAVDGEWYTIASASTGELRPSTAVGSVLFPWTQSPNISDTPTKFVSYPFKLTIPVSCIAIGCYKNGKYFEYTSVQLEVGDTASDIEPYQGITIPINWESEAGTVYGGKLDLLSGKLTVERTTAIYDGTETYSNAYFPIVVCTKVLQTGKGDGSTFLCSHLPTGTYYASFSSNQKKAIQFSHCDTVWNVASADELKAKIAEQYANGTPVTFVYPLATPIEIQLTPTEVRSLLGVNNIFADTGDTEVTYRADPTLYIQRLTEPDADMIADSNIVSGQYFMVGNSLFKATANIASGAQVIVGTNATRKSLSEALNEINA